MLPTGASLLVPSGADWCAFLLPFLFPLVQFGASSLPLPLPLPASLSSSSGASSLPLSGPSEGSTEDF
jgi:hypothetical protein